MLHILKDKKALGFLNEVVFTEKYGARASAPKVLVILTDGQDAAPQLVIEEVFWSVWTNNVDHFMCQSGLDRPASPKLLPDFKRRRFLSC